MVPVPPIVAALDPAAAASHHSSTWDRLRGRTRQAVDVHVPHRGFDAVEAEVPLTKAALPHIFVVVDDSLRMMSS